MMDEIETRKKRFLFLTLTIKNCRGHDLGRSVSDLFNGYRKLMLRSRIKKSVLGAFRTLEITINAADGSYHPHLHCILVVDGLYFDNPSKYIKHSEWVDLWQECCGLDYSPSVRIEAVKQGKNGHKNAVKEVAKYVAKDSDFLSGDMSQVVVKVAHLLDGISARRLCSFSGIMADVRKELKLDDIEDGDLVHVEDSIRPDLTEIIVRYSWRSGVYVRDAFAHEV